MTRNILECNIHQKFWQEKILINIENKKNCKKIVKKFSKYFVQEKVWKSASENIYGMFEFDINEIVVVNIKYKNVLSELSRENEINKTRNHQLSFLKKCNYKYNKIILITYLLYSLYYLIYFIKVIFLAIKVIFL